MKKNKIFLLITLILLLLSVSYATELSNDTRGNDDALTNTVQTSTSTQTVEQVIKEEPNNKKITKTAQNKTTKTASTTVDVKDFNTLHKTLTSNKYDTVTLNIKSDIKLTDNTELNTEIKKLTINGNGKTLNGDNKYQFLTINSNGNVTIKNIKIIKCLTAIHNIGGNLTITECTLNNNTASKDGGAICNYANITIIKSTLNNNLAEYGDGGAIYNSGKLTLNKSTLYNNKATIITYDTEWFGGLGGAIYNTGNITITSTTLNKNKASSAGGAIYNTNIIIDDPNVRQIDYLGRITIIQSILKNNIAPSSYGGYGGAIYNLGILTINKSTLYNNKGDRGGAICNTQYITDFGAVIENSGEVTIIQSTLYNNKAELGGAISNECNMTITQSTLNNNTAEYGGAINNWGNMTLNNNTLNNNKAKEGGAINNAEPLTITQSTLNYNTAESGGAIINGGKLTITKSTLNNNKATSDGGAVYVSYYLKYKNSKNVVTTHIKNNTFNKNTAKRGSAIFINETTHTWIKGKYTNNTKVTITYITNNIFKQNKAKTKGSSIINKGNNTRITNNTNMTKSQDSSTIHIVQGTNTLIQSNTFRIPIITTITITPIKQKTYKENVTITGKLADKTGKLLKNIKVKVKINTKTYTVKTNTKGIYTLKVTANKVGANNVTVSYAGNNNYKAVTAKTTFKTVARATKLTVNKISATTKGKKVKITGKLTDNTKSSVMNSLVKIKINKKTVKVKTNKEGIYTYNYKTTTKGTNTVTVTFAGSTNYKKTSAKTSFKVK